MAKDFMYLTRDYGYRGGKGDVIIVDRIDEEADIVYGSPKDKSNLKDFQKDEVFEYQLDHLSNIKPQLKLTRFTKTDINELADWLDKNNVGVVDSNFTEEFKKERTDRQFMTAMMWAVNNNVILVSTDFMKKHFHNLEYAKGGELSDNFKTALTIKPHHSDRSEVKELIEYLINNMVRFRFSKAPNNELDYIEVSAKGLTMDEVSDFTDYLDRNSWDYEMEWVDYAKGGLVKKSDYTMLGAGLLIGGIFAFFKK